MENLKNKKVGRPKYQVNMAKLKELFKQVENKTITNEEGWKKASCHTVLILKSDYEIDI